MMSQLPSQFTGNNLSLKERLALSAYNLLWCLLLPFFFIHWLIKTLSGDPDFGKSRLSRFAIFPSDLRHSDILIHCVSVGEANVAISLVKALQARAQTPSITISTTTATGAANIKRQLGESVQHIYLPIDLSFFMGRLIKRLTPKQVWVVEVELWPNMLRQCVKKQIPVSVINARMTDKSRQRYAKIPSLFGAMLHNVHQVCAQSQRDYDNYVKLGMPEFRCSNTGNIKFDTLEQGEADMGLNTLLAKRACLVAGSTHEPEEQMLIDATNVLCKRYDDILLIIAPRHPQRFDKVEQLLKASKLSYCKLSTLGKQALSDQCRILFVDTMGVLNQFYQHARIAFIGGSIAQRGGHNALEAAYWSIPVLMGPSTYNNPEICAALGEAGNLQTVSSTTELIACCDRLLGDDTLRAAAGAAGRNVIEKNRGAIQGTLQKLGFYGAAGHNN